MAPTATPSEITDFSNIRMVASDLDGTLIVGQFNAGQLTQRTVDVLHALEAKGIRIVFASGRPPRTMIRAVEQAQLKNLMVICCNGAQVLDSHTMSIVKRFSIPPEHVKAICTKVKDALGDTAFIGVESGATFKCEAGYAKKRQHAMYHEYITVDDPRTDFCNDAVEKIIVVHESWPADQLYKFLMENIFNEPQWLDIICPTFSSLHFVEISAANVSKATALKYLCEKLEIGQDQLMAFGDMPNDLEMIKFAGIGVAMGNAHPDVKAAASLVTKTNVEDGVAVVLEKMFEQL